MYTAGSSESPDGLDGSKACGSDFNGEPGLFAYIESAVRKEERLASLSDGCVCKLAKLAYSDSLHQ